MSFFIFLYINYSFLDENQTKKWTKNICLLSSIGIKPRGSTNHKLCRLHPGLRMISRIKHLQHAKLYPSTRVANTKSMTPNQLRLRASRFKGFHHIPLGPCSGFKAKRHGFILLFLLFFFFFLFLFFFIWKTTLAFIYG